MRRSWKYINGLSIRAKLTIMFVGGYAAFLVFFWNSMATSRSNQQHMMELVENYLPTIEAAGRLEILLDRVRVQIVQGALAQSMDNVNSFKPINEAIEEKFGDLVKLASEDSQKLEELRKDYQITFKASSALVDDVVAGLESMVKAQTRLQEQVKSLNQITNEISQVKKKYENIVKLSVESSGIASRRLIWFGFILLVFAVPVGVQFYRVINGIHRELKSMSERLHEASNKIMSIAATAQVSSHQLAANSAEQASSVDRSVSSMDEMKHMLSQTAKHSENALTASETSFHEAANGQRVMNSMREAMNEIEMSYHELEEVNALVSEIRSKTAVINEIVFKTQILSFNASLEAARAGVHGRGFAVVAEEVGKLAVMSGAAGEEIDRMLDHGAMKIAETIDRTHKKVEVANQLSQECSEVFGRINDRTEQAKSMVGLISHAAAEQNSGIQSVSQAMNELSKAAVESNMMAQSISDLAILLKTESGGLTNSVNALNGLVQGATSARFQVPPKKLPKLESIPLRRSA